MYAFQSACLSVSAVSAECLNHSRGTHPWLQASHSRINDDIFSRFGTSVSIRSQAFGARAVTPARAVPASRLNDNAGIASEGFEEAGSDDRSSNDGYEFSSASVEATHAEIRAEVSRRIRRFARAGDLAGAVEAFTRMQIEGVAPDTMAATALIDCCVRCGELARAERAFVTLFPPSGPLKPDAIAVGVLLRAYGQRKPVQWNKIQQFLQKVEADYSMPPSAAIFNELMEICARDNEVDRGLQLLERMQSLQVEPDLFTMEAVRRRRALRSHFKKLFPSFAM